MIRAVVGILIASCVLIGDARAAIVHGSFHGTIYEGSDYTGVFGTPGSSLAGQSITGKFTFDTVSLFDACPQNGPQGACYNGNSPAVISFEETILGQTFAIQQSSLFQLTLGDGTGDPSQRDQLRFQINELAALFPSSAKGIELIMSSFSQDFIHGIAAEQAITITSPESSDGVTSIYSHPNGSAESYFQAYFRVSEFTMAVPEPSALLLLGIGLLVAVKKMRQPKPTPSI